MATYFSLLAVLFNIFFYNVAIYKSDEAWMNRFEFQNYYHAFAFWLLHV